MKIRLQQIITGISAFAVIAGAAAIGRPMTVAADEQQQQQPETPAIWLQISPVSNRVSLSPGQVVEDKFTVENTGSADFSYKVYAAPYSVTNEDYDLSFSNESNYTKITSWLTFRQGDGEWSKNPTFSIPKGGKQTIEYRITVPEDVPAGGQYATLFAESVDESNTPSSTGIKTSSRVGLVLYGAVAGDTRREGTITDYDFSHFLLGGHITGTSKIKNSGNIDFNTNYSFTVSSLFGKTLYEDSSSASVLPDTERRIKHEWEETPWIGIFNVHYRVNALNDTRDETAVVFVMPLIAIILFILFLTILIIWTIIAVRKSKERKARKSR